MTRLEHYPARIVEQSEGSLIADACRKLWVSVLERTAADLVYLQRMSGREQLEKHELEKVRRIQDQPPAEFVAGEWFETVCRYVGINDVDAARAWIAAAEYRPPLSDTERDEIAAMCADGMPIRLVADAFDTSEATVYRIAPRAAQED